MFLHPCPRCLPCIREARVLLKWQNVTFLPSLPSSLGWNKIELNWIESCVCVFRHFATTVVRAFTCTRSVIRDGACLQQPRTLLSFKPPAEANTYGVTRPEHTLKQGETWKHGHKSRKQDNQIPSNQPNFLVTCRCNNQHTLLKQCVNTKTNKLSVQYISALHSRSDTGPDQRR